MDIAFQANAFQISAFQTEQAVLPKGATVTVEVRGGWTVTAAVRDPMEVEAS